MIDYKLSMAFCTIDETYSLKQAYQSISVLNLVDEFVFIIAQNASFECIQTVMEICLNPNCRYVFQRKKGLGNAIQEAMELVIGTHLIVWPADNDMDVSSFPEMVRISQENPKKIITVSRWLAEDGFKEYGRIKTMLNYLSQKAFSLLYKVDLTDFTNPTQIAPIDIYRNIKWVGNGFDFIPELIFKPLKLGCDFIEVPCKTLRRQEGKQHRRFKELIKYYFVILKIHGMSEEDIIVGDKS
ncbi:MAG: glycosyltransferase [Clostridia bacterium]|nr:glycosyltransferase [Clostridia bacterium]MBQ3603839.1 glycosyltransferase [Clostridia bacterium]